MNTRGLSVIIPLCLGLALACLWLLLLMPEPAHAGPDACVAGPHSGTISFSQEWCAADNPHIVSSLTVAAGVTLTIEGGAEILVNGNQAMNVNGVLVAEGTSSQPITFTSSSATPQPGDWGAINFQSGSRGRLAYCDVAYAGAPGGSSIGLHIQTSDVTVSHCRIHDTNGHPVYIQGMGLTPLFEDVEIDHNPQNYPLRQSTIAQNPSYTNVWLHDNNVDALWIPLSNVDRNVTLDGSPAALNGAPIYYEGGNVNAGSTLTVTAGTTIKMAGNRTLNVIGGLVAEGSPTSPVTFTTQSAAPLPGDWGAISLESGSRGRLAYCDIAYGGAPGGSSIGLHIQTSDVTVRHCRIHDTNGHPVYIQGTGLTPLFEDVEIDHNPQNYPLRQSTIAQNPSYTNVWLHDNNVDVLWIPPSHVDRDMTLDGSPIALNGAPIYYGGGNVNAGYTLTVTAGTTIKFAGNTGMNVYGSLVAEGTPALPVTFTSQSAAPQPGDWAAISLQSGSHASLAYCDIGYGGSAGGAGNGLYIASSDVTVHHCRIHDTSGRAIKINDNIQVAMQNLALTDNPGTAIHLQTGASLDGSHLTLARDGTGIYVMGGATLAITNTIFAQNTTGLSVGANGIANLAQALWDRNTTDIIGAVNETGHIEGPAGFDVDGYHITRYSAGLGQGVDAGATDDIDGDARPLPAGTAPDLGADEYPYLLGEDFAAEKVAFAPQWVILPDPEGGEPLGLLRQRYLLRYYYGSPDPNPPALTISITDTLPADLDLVYESHNPEMSFTQQGQTLTWQTASPVAVGQSGEIQLSTLYAQPEPGRDLVNQAELNAAGFHFDLLAATAVPLFPPLIISPGNGEICPDPAGSVTLSGMAQGGALIRVYENGVEVISTTAAASGAFTAVYTSTHVGIDAQTTLTAKACAPSDPDHCSDASQPLTLTEPLSFWCPQRSIWEDDVNGRHVTYRFRDASGWFSAQDWVISGIFGFSDTDLTLYTCNCPAWSGTTAAPSSVWVVADGVTYYPTGAHPWYHFDITGGAHTAVFWAQCGANQISSDGRILVDPDGYVFDVTQGFDPPSPTLHAVSGVTVTAYISMSEWGGWVPWPAALYNDQQNPQITGADGYFAFFAPPGQYYLQVEGKEGYQPWRSPVIEVITQVVHVNVPLTPWPETDITMVTLTEEGPVPAVITITVGDSVEWVSELSGVIPPEELIQLVENPVLRLLSDLDPLADTHAWDGGMLAPGQIYRRQFTQVGTYPYTDGAGHAGQVVVVNLAPTADAGPDQNVLGGALVTLSAAASSDPDGHLPLTYQWVQTGGEPVVLSDPNAASPTFTAPDVETMLTFTLVVTDSYGAVSATDTVTIVVRPTHFYLYMPIVVR